MNKATIEKLKDLHFRTSEYRSETELKKESYSYKWSQEIKNATKRIKAIEKAIKLKEEAELVECGLFDEDELKELLGGFPKIDFPS